MIWLFLLALNTALACINICLEYYYLLPINAVAIAVCLFFVYKEYES